MSKEIIYSFKEYQEKYTLLLGDFCTNTEFDEIDFITTEIDFYSIHLTSLSIYKRIRHRFPGDPFLDEDTIFLNTNCASYDFIVETIKNKAINRGLKTTDDIITNCKIQFNKIISFLETKKLELEAPQQIEKVKTKKPKKTLLEFIHNVGDKEGFILGLKNAFPTEIGKDIRVIIDTLQEKDILIIGAREYKNFVEVLAVYFGRSIGEYSGIQNAMTITIETSDPINKKLKPLITKYKTI